MVTVWSESGLPPDSTVLPDSATYIPLELTAHTAVYTTEQDNSLTGGYNYSAYHIYSAIWSPIV